MINTIDYEDSFTTFGQGKVLISVA